MSMPAERPSVSPDRITLPLLRFLAFLGFAFSVWPATAGSGSLYPYVGAFGVGVIVALFYWHPHRVLGFAAPALTAAFLGTLAALLWGWCGVSAAVAGAGTGLACGVFARPRGVGRFTDRSWWQAAAVFLTAAALGATPLVSSAAFGTDPDAARRLSTLVAAALLGIATVPAWPRLLRPAFELAVEPILWLMYRVRPGGPGLKEVPAHGPCLVIANHACWFDPLFLAKVLPRPITPMMTSRFYDLPVMRWLVRHLFRAIRVPEKPLKQDTPELQEAIAALDRGECVVVFPEGYLRRSEEKPLKRFGRGVWQILKARPDTPVVACWIEGAWGSYASYLNGPPTKNKKPDVRRPIGVGVSAPVVVDTGLLESHLKTRLGVMNRVASARTALGLPELPLYELPDHDDDRPDPAGDPA